MRDNAMTTAQGANIRVPVPANYWPGRETQSDLTAHFPDHEFSIKEAVDDYKRFAQERGITSSDHNRTFYKSIAAILRRRKPGPVSFTGGSGGNSPRSVRAFLAGSR